MKIIFFDVETTGLDSKVNGMHQLAGDMVIDGKIVRHFDFRINPFEGCEVDSKALAISNTSSLDFLNYHKEFQVMYMLNEILMRYKDFANEKDKFFLAGWRAPEFDVKFLRAFFDRNKKDAFEYYFWSNPIDVKTLATQYLIEKRPQMESFSLASVAKYLGIKIVASKLHKASYDAYLSRKVYELLPTCMLGEARKK